MSAKIICFHSWLRNQVAPIVAETKTKKTRKKRGKL